MKPDQLSKRLRISKIGNIRAVFHRPLPQNALLKTCIVVREPCGEWYASLVYEEVVPMSGIEVPVVKNSMPLQADQSPVGIDLGLLALVTTSDGAEVSHPNFLRRAEIRLRHLHRDLSRKKRGSKNRWKARKRVASFHAKVARQRADFNHKLGNKLVAEHDLIGFENLRIWSMVKNHALAKSISDSGWGQLVRFAEYKAREKRRLVVKVEPAYSTRECYFCGALNKTPLGVRESACVGCGRTLRRDHNSAMIVLKRALAKVGQGMPKLKPVEAEPLPIQTTECASLAVEAGTRSPVQEGEWDVTKTE